jgi:hypothetical protein
METNKGQIQEMITNIYDVGEWMMEVVGGDSDNMEEHIRVMLDKLDDTIVYLRSKQKEM